MRYEKGNQMSHIRTARIARNKQARARKFLNYCGELPCEFPAKTKVPANYSWCSPDLNRRSDLDAEQEDLEKNKKFAVHWLLATISSTVTTFYGAPILATAIEEFINCVDFTGTEGMRSGTSASGNGGVVILSLSGVPRSRSARLANS